MDFAGECLLSTKYSLAWMYHSLFITSEEHLISSEVFAIMNKLRAVNILVQVICVCGHTFFSSFG